MVKVFDGEEQSLEQIMNAREERANFQSSLSKTLGKTVIAYKLNIPGPVKYSFAIREIFDEGVTILKKELVKLIKDAGLIVYEKAFYENSGPEFFIVVDWQAEAIKRLVVNIEDTHELGRLMDFDVIKPSGEGLSRSDFNLPQRKCFICDEDAVVCGRSRRHDVESLQASIASRYTTYFK